MTREKGCMLSGWELLVPLSVLGSCHTHMCPTPDSNDCRLQISERQLDMTLRQMGCNSCSCHLALLFMGYIQAQGQFSSSCQWGTRSQNIAVPLFPLNGFGTSTSVCEDHLSQWMSLPLLSLGSHSVWTTTGVQQPPALMGWATPGSCTGLLQLPP